MSASERPPHRRGGTAVALWALLLVAALGLWSAACEADDQASDGGGPPVRRGGELRIGIDPITNLDPHFATTASDILLSMQVYDRLVETDARMQPVPGLATSWESADALAWTFTLRKDVTFHNGEPFTAADVVFSLRRLRDPDVGSPLVGLLSNVQSIEADGDHSVIITLATPDAELPSELADHHAAILSRSVDDPKNEWVGTGPFALKGGITQEGVELTRFDEYWGTDSSGEPLPYLDRIRLVVTAGPGARLAALRSGELDFVGGLTPKQAAVVDKAQLLRLLTTPGNTYWAVHIRCDADHPGQDTRLRRALALATDREALAERVRPDLAELGNGTCVGPAYGPAFLDEGPAYDPDEARELLAAAGFADGLEIPLLTPDTGDAPAIAAAWKEQMAAVGVTVDVRTVPETEYYGDGDANWLEADFGLTDWGTRSTPVTYFELAYESGAPYNQSHWDDPEFDELTEQIRATMDVGERSALYQRAQRLLQEQVPAIVPFLDRAAAGTSTTLRGVDLHPIWARTRFATARFTEEQAGAAQSRCVSITWSLPKSPICR